MLTPEDKALVKKWLNGTGFKAQVAATVHRNQWMSEKQRKVLDGTYDYQRNLRLQAKRRPLTGYVDWDPHDAEFHRDFNELADAMGGSPWGDD